MGLNWGWKEIAVHRNTVESAIRETDRWRGQRREAAQMSRSECV